MAGRPYDLLTLAARTTSGTAAIPADFSDEDDFRVHIRVTAVSGTTPALTVSLQDSLDGGANWATVASSASLSTVSVHTLSLARTTPHGPMLRLSWTITGTTPSFTFETKMWAK